MTYNSRRAMQYIFKVFISISFIISGSSFYTTISNRKIHRAKFELQKVGYDDVDQSEEEMKRKMAWAKHTLMTVAASIMCVPPDVLTTPPMVDPRPPTNSLERLHYGKIRSIFSKAYPEPTFEIPQNEIELIDETNNSNGSGHNPSTYGEVTLLGAKQLFYYMGMLKNCEDKKQGGIHFIDLGSGNGKLCVQAYLEIPNLKKAEGIELSPSRHSIGINSWNKIKEEANCIRSQTVDFYGVRCSNCGEAEVKLIQGDLFQMDISKATHIYVASLCFTDEMILGLCKKFGEQGNNLQYIATLKLFPAEFEKRYGFKRDVKYVEMSWTKPRGMGGIVYFYSRDTE